MSAFMRKCGILTLLSASGPCIWGQQPNAKLCGVVVDEHDAGIKGALIVASGAGFKGWATTNPDGAFCLKSAGAFISVRHGGFDPIIERTPPPGTTIRLRLVRADAKVMTLADCKSLPNSGRDWIGGGLRINPGKRRYRGPVNGEHDTHWYLRKGRQSLHVVDGYAWHAGLPLESLLLQSSSFEVRGWEFGDIVGLDISGISKDGRQWRWIGAPIADAISYQDATPDEAAFFNGVLQSICFSATR